MGEFASRLDNGAKFRTRRTTEMLANCRSLGPGTSHLPLQSRWPIVALFGLMLLALLPHRASAQAGATGAISGIITDAQGAAIVGAEIQARQLATGVISTTKTNDAGVFTFPYLQIGQYEVRMSAPGMKETVVTGVVVDQSNISRLDHTLEVGAVGERVTVTTAAPVIQQE